MSDEELQVPFDHDLVYRRGWQDGYEAAEAAANRAWAQSSSWRPGLVEADQYVTIDGKRERVLSWRERKEQDLSVLAQAHAAGLHTGQAIRCPLCVPAEPCAVDPTHPARDDQGNMHVHVGSPLHHKGHYGVADRAVTPEVRLPGHDDPHGAHPHNGMTCLDCPECFPSSHYAAGDV
jgi:hypothetical protein